jgi:hypothetical protein
VLIVGTRIFGLLGDGCLIHTATRARRPRFADPCLFGDQHRSTGGFDNPFGFRDERGERTISFEKRTAVLRRAFHFVSAEDAQIGRGSTPAASTN